LFGGIAFVPHVALDAAKQGADSPRDSAAGCFDELVRNALLYHPRRLLRDILRDGCPLAVGSQPSFPFTQSSDVLGRQLHYCIPNEAKSAGR
jgi:hypothetical protein